MDTKLKTDLIEQRVRKGGAWLDEQKPGWFYLIDLGDLDLGCGQRCILGQLWASEAMERTLEGRGHWNGFGVVTYASSPDFVIGHGFLRQFDAYTHADLDEAWITYIKERVNNAA